MTGSGGTTAVALAEDVGSSTMGEDEPLADDTSETDARGGSGGGISACNRLAFGTKEFYLLPSKTYRKS